MRLPSFFAIASLFYPLTMALANNGKYPLGARSSALSNASVCHSDAWSTQNNQAGLAFMPSLSGSVYYENKFLIKQLGLKAAVLALPLKQGTFGLLISNFGYALYNENKYAVSYAKSFGKKLAIGVSMDYMSTTIGEGYGKTNRFVVEMGILSKPTKNLSIGAHLFNPTHSKISNNTDERLPTLLRLGGCYSFSEKVTLSVETQKDISQKAIFKTGIEYQVADALCLRGGFSNHPALSSFGMGILLKNWRFDLAANYHQALGVSPQFSLTYSAQPKKKHNP